MGKGIKPCDRESPFLALDACALNALNPMISRHGREREREGLAKVNKPHFGKGECPHSPNITPPTPPSPY